MAYPSILFWLDVLGTVGEEGLIMAKTV